MIRQRAGRIINLSSGAANKALEGWSHYCASKAAVKMLTQSGDKELKQYGIQTIGLSPGTVATDMMAEIKDSGINPVSQLDWNSHITPEIVANSIAFLCTQSADQYSGEDFSIKTEQGRAEVEALFPGTFSNK
jgi:NAD(P)-dependent dehydrogenase (short-subunit alcohol dehydrogenase family)